MPLPNVDHRSIVGDLGFAFISVTADGDHVCGGVNVSDLRQEWLSNYREPEIAVYLSSSPANECITHWVGGPDLTVEIVSRDEDPHETPDFYAEANIRDRQP